MSQKDYYKILGVSESAADDQIKSAYRKLAKQFHPDTNPGNKSAEEKFKEISEAYYVLSDKKKRADYDAFKKSGFSGGHGGGARGFQGAQGFDYEDLMRAFRGASQQGGRRTTMHFGGSAAPFASIFEGLFGGGGFTGGGEEDVLQTVSADASATLKVSRSRAEKGGEVSFTIQGGKKITVKIPAGITSGKKLRLSRQGNICPTCEHPGDLILTIRVE